MGYETVFTGSFRLNKEMSDKLYNFLIKFNQKEHIAMYAPPKYGIQAEFLVDPTKIKAFKRIKSKIHHPITQPSEHCNWVASDKKHLKHDGGLKPYSYIEWLVYLINKVFAPNGYVLHGKVKWKGEDRGDFGTIHVRKNRVYYSIRNQKEKEMTPQNAERFEKFITHKQNDILVSSPVYINDFMRTDVVWKE
jgi:hypothetical protein